MSSTPLAAPRVVITAHSADGTSIFASDEQVTPFAPFGPAGSQFARFHSRLSVPVSNVTSPPAQLAQTLPRCAPNGVLFCTTDIPAGGRAPMHRTLSLDYAIVLSGEIVLRLDGGDERTVKAGEFIVQRGANHEWINRAAETCRIAVVMIGAEKIVLENGTALEETVFKKPGA
jgi:quercetin dioxygenase-like cupin family protein